MVVKEFGVSEMPESNNNKYDSIALKKEHMLNSRYIIQDVIGVGGFGITYRGYDVYNREIYAIKELFINDTVMRDRDGATVIPYENKRNIFEHGVKRFMEEASILHKLNGTRNVVRITDYFRENNTAYFVMEYIEGSTLRGLMSEYGGVIPYDVACGIILKVGKTLAYINKKYFIFHRDLSPENILINKKGEPVIIDFGNAKNYMRNEGNSLSIVLKPGFAPPEQYTGKDQGPWTDVYSLAGIFYYITSGERVPPATERVMGATYEPLAGKLPQCSSEVSDMIDRGLAINPRERIQDTGQLVSIFDKAVLGCDKGTSREKAPYVGVLLNGKSVEKWKLPIDANMIAGRDENQSNIVIPESNQISKQHVVISYAGKEHVFEIIDISTNGVYVNKERLKKGTSYKMKVGTQLVLGNDICRLDLGVS